MKKNIIVLLSIFLYCGCSGFSTPFDKATLANFSGKKTYAWLTSVVPSDDIRVNNPTIQGLVQSAVEEELAKKGYVMTAAEDADFLMAWFGSIDEVVKEVHISAFYRPYGYGTLVGSKPDSVDGDMATRVYKTGTLILDIIDPRTKSVFWRESAVNAITKKMSNPELSNYIDRSVEKLLERVPAADQ
ncbi:MAG: DUF4136 domain-containing protein [Desulforhopalus sp.]